MRKFRRPWFIAGILWSSSWRHRRSARMFLSWGVCFLVSSCSSAKSSIWVCLKMVSTPKPNGFADHYPVFKWLFHWGYTPFSDKPISFQAKYISESFHRRRHSKTWSKPPQPLPPNVAWPLDDWNSFMQCWERSLPGHKLTYTRYMRLIHTYVYNTYVYIYIYTYIHVCIHDYEYVYIYIYIYIYIHMYVYVCICVHMYMYIIYTGTYIDI